MHTCKLKGIVCDMGTLIMISRMRVFIYVCVIVHLPQQILYDFLSLRIKFFARDYHHAVLLL